jgi:hypothetical protein
MGQDLTFEEVVAQVVHAADSTLADLLGLPQRELDDERKRDLVEQARMGLTNPAFNEAARHQYWLEQQHAKGWGYGIEYNEETKQDPSIVPYHRLAPQDRLRYRLQHAITEILRTEMQNITFPQQEGEAEKEMERPPQDIQRGEPADRGDHPSTATPVDQVAGHRKTEQMG